MKRIILITIFIFGLTAGYGVADMGGHMGSGQGTMGSGQGMMGAQNQQQTGGSGYYPCQHMMGGMMGPGMMGGYGMMGSGHMGGMMGQGHMGGGMMGSGHMGGMMGGYGYRGNNPEAYKKYLDDTVDLRKKLHNKMFEYREVLRDPDTTRKSLLKIEKEMMDLQWKIYEKAPGE